MAAMVASHAGGLWQRRSSQIMHISPMGMPAMMPGSAAPASTRPYQPQDHVDLSIFPPTSAAPHMVPFQAAPYGFDIAAMNQYSVQQQYMAFTQSLPTQVSYATASGDLTSTTPTVREARNIAPSADRSPSVKSEAHSPVESAQLFSRPKLREQVAEVSPTEAAAVTFSTDVDCLMRAIQQQHTPSQSAQPSTQEPQLQQLESHHSKQPSYSGQSRCSTEGRSKSRKRYVCTIPNCNKSFYQKTHLEIHTRAHTGHKPFVCKEPSCGQRFSQLGNLKTHERRHTGERPYNCDICGKTFAQRGNVRAHKIVHQQIKPFTCKLDDCGKQFTQLGNLKSHQNKFHSQTLRYLTSKFSQIREGDQVTQQDKELWEYFARLYKNSNKGIKGRGKDRRISQVSPPASSYTASAPSSASSATSMHHHSLSSHSAHSGRSSRSSSFVSAEETLSPQHARADDAGYHHHFEDQSAAYGNLVFPERKMY